MLGVAPIANLGLFSYATDVCCSSLRRLPTSIRWGVGSFLAFIPLAVAGSFLIVDEIRWLPVLWESALTGFIVGPSMAYRERLLQPREDQERTE